MPVDLRQLLDQYNAARFTTVRRYREWQGIVRRFGQALGRAPTTADLDTDTLTRAGKYLLSRGRTSRTIEDHLAFLGTLWRYAYQAGLTGCIPPHRHWRWISSLPAMPCVVETARSNRQGQRPEPEIALPTFDGAAVNAAASETVAVKREKFSRYRKRW